MENNSVNKNNILLTVIGVATLLVALVGATFAYFTASVDNSKAESVFVTTVAPVGLQYLGHELSMPKAMPGDVLPAPEDKSGNNIFTVTNPENSPSIQTYDLDLVIDTNGFTYTTKENAGNGTPVKNPSLVQENEKQLQFTLSASGTTNQPALKQGIEDLDLTDGKSTAAPGKKFKIVDDQRIAVGETQTYTMGLNFIRFEYEQNNNKGVSFSAHIEISDPLSVKE